MQKVGRLLANENRCEENDRIVYVVRDCSRKKGSVTQREHSFSMDSSQYKSTLLRRGLLPRPMTPRQGRASANRSPSRDLTCDSSQLTTQQDNLSGNLALDELLKADSYAACRLRVLKDANACSRFSVFLPCAGGTMCQRRHASLVLDDATISVMPSRTGH